MHFISRNKTNPFLQVFLWMNAKHNQSNFSVTHEDSNDLFLLLFCTKPDIILYYKKKNIFVWSPGAILLNAEAGKNIYRE